MEAVQAQWSCEKCGSRYDAGVKYCLHCRTEAQLKKAANPYNNPVVGFICAIGLLLFVAWIVLNVIGNSV